jgi:hypothetical protein
VFGTYYTKVSKKVQFEEQITGDIHLTELGKAFGKNKLPERIVEYILKKLLRQHSRWRRVFELKHMEVRELSLPRQVKVQLHQIPAGDICPRQ